VKVNTIAGSNPATLTNIMQGKLFKILMAVEKYLPKKLKEKILHYILKRNMKKLGKGMLPDTKENRNKLNDFLNLPKR
jgi:hypothetical protein